MTATTPIEKMTNLELAAWLNGHAPFGGMGSDKDFLDLARRVRQLARPADPKVIDENTDPKASADAFLWHLQNGMYGPDVARALKDYQRELVEGPAMADSTPQMTREEQIKALWLAYMGVGINSEDIECYYDDFVRVRDKAARLFGDPALRARVVELETRLRATNDWLADEQMTKWNYIEGGQFWDERYRQVQANLATLAATPSDLARPGVRTDG